MERDNEKERARAKKEYVSCVCQWTKDRYNDLVRQLANHLRKRDPRVKDEEAKLQEAKAQRDAEALLDNARRKASLSGWLCFKACRRNTRRAANST